MRTELKDDRLVAYLEGKIDSANAPKIQRELSEAIGGNPGRRLEIDAGALKYISSAGLRVLLQFRKAQGGLTVREVSPEIFDILDMTGFTELLDVKKRLRELSVEGCEIVGRGAIGTVYRVDEDTIVKVYELPDSLPMIENEQRRAKQAFLKGIPTAISYDVVKVGDKYGSVFEMVKASTYNDLIIQQPDRWDEIIREYASFLRRLHGVEMDPGELPDARDVFLDYLDRLKDVLTDGLYARLRALFSAMPENLHVIHGDVQMKNVMLSEGEPLLIDMDTLSVGDPVFELMGLYMGYVLFNEDDPTNSRDFLGISEDACWAIWNGVLQTYFDGLDEAAMAEVERRIIVVALVRFLFLVAALNIGKPELKQLRIVHTLSHLEEMTPQVDSLEVGSLGSKPCL